MKKLQKIVDWLVYSFLFLLPWQVAWIWQERFLDGAKWQYGTMVIYATEVLLWVIFILQLIVWLKTKKFKFSIFKLQRSSVILIIWLLVVWSGLSIVWSGDKMLSFYHWFRLLEVVALFFVLLNWQLRFKRLWWLVFWAGVIQGLLAIYQFLAQNISASKWLGLAAHSPADLGTIVIQVGPERWLRAYGAFTHPNILGGFLLVSLLVGVYLYLNSKIGWPKIGLTIGLIIITAGLFFSFSRSAWLAGLTVYAVWLVLALFKNNRDIVLNFLKPLFYVVVTVLVLFLVYQPLTVARFSVDQRLESQSIAERLDQYSEARQIIKSRPWFGVGIGNYTTALSQFKPDQPAYSYQPVHNLWLLVWAEMGLFGLVIFISMLLILFFRSIQTENIFGLGLLVGFLVVGFFDHYLWTQYAGMIIFWLGLTFLVRDDTN